MKSKWFMMAVIFWAFSSVPMQAQEIKMAMETEMEAPESPPAMKLKGYHVGVVQPIISINKGETTNLFTYDNYAIGFPTGITFSTGLKLLIDLEMVPFIAPLIERRENFNVHLLYHPGVLLPLDGGFTVGLRAAFESGTGQFGYTLLLNKSFDICKSTKFFFELVAPGRWGPNEKSGYTQVFAFHMGLGF